MNLIITDSDKEFGMRFHKISCSEFAMPEMQPYLANTAWDKVVIDLCQNMPLGIIPQMVAKGFIVEPLVLDETNLYKSVKVMNIVGEIYRDSASSLRFAFMKDKAKYKELLNNLLKIGDKQIE